MDLLCSRFPVTLAAGGQMSKSLLDEMALSLGISPIPDRRQQGERRSEWRGERRSQDFEALVEVRPALRPDLERASRYTWVHDHDVLEMRFVN